MARLLDLNLKRFVWIRIKTFSVGKTETRMGIPRLGEYKVLYSCCSKMQNERVLTGYDKNKMLEIAQDH